jgi:hypothetical protein
MAATDIEKGPMAGRAAAEEIPWEQEEFVGTMAR